MKSQAYAKENLEKARIIKNNLKQERGDEIRKFSPIQSKENLIATSCDNRKLSNLNANYNDFLNDVFANKTHQAYKLREKNDLKINFIETKYGQAFNRDDPEAEKKANDELQKRTLEKFKQLDSRLK